GQDGVGRSINEGSISQAGSTTRCFRRNLRPHTRTARRYGMGHRPDQQRACAGKSSQGTAVP
ncbi:hypothetical protein, partial [Chlamydia suis]|uniref:hypothetical protein n=1 Tax=Chlamydia suis TaxID=83559 RepID=UPI001969E386